MDKSVSNVNYSLNSSQQVNISFNTSSQKYKSSKTPLKTPSKKTPSRIRLGNRTLSPHSPFAADRFIPDRNAMNIELSQYLVSYPLVDLVLHFKCLLICRSIMTRIL